MGKPETKVEVLPPAYQHDSDVESIIKPEGEEVQIEGKKALPKWQNNIVLRTSRRRYIAVGVISTLIILAVILGALRARGIIGAPKPVECLKWAPRDPMKPATYRGDDSGRYENGDLDCVAWSDGFVSVPGSSTDVPNYDGRKCRAWTTATPSPTNSAVPVAQPYVQCAEWE